MHWAEKGCKNQNRKAEREIGILKQRWQRRMTRQRVHNRLWDYGLVYKSEILSRLSRGHDGRIGYERLTRVTPDISECLDFDFYDLVWYHADPRNTDKASRQIGKCLGISHRVGSDMCYWILTAAGKVTSNTSVQHVILDEQGDPVIKLQIAEFETRLDERLHDAKFTTEDPRDRTPYIQDIDIPNNPTRRGVIHSDKEYGDMTFEEKLSLDKYDNYEQYNGANYSSTLSGRITKRVKGLSVEKIGQSQADPLFDTRSYMVEFQDGSVEEFTANVIAESIYAQVDDEGNQYALMKEITDHRKDGNAIAKEDGYTIGFNGNRISKEATKGWQLLVEWKDGDK
jgi:hypothetical protein